MSFVFKKISLLTSEFPPLPGGIGNHAFNLANQLTAKGFEIVVCTDQRSVNLQDDVKFDQELSFKVERVKRYSFIFLTYFVRFWTSFSQAKKNQIIFSSGKFSLWLGAILKLIFRQKKFIGILHGSELFAGNKIQQSFTRWSLKQFDNLIAVSNFTKEKALQLEKTLSIEVINNGFFFPEKREDIQFLVGFPKIVTVGNVTYRKGQQNIINTLPTLKKIYPDIHYHIVGLPTEKKDFTKLAKRLGVLELITFHGTVSNDKLRTIVTSCDIFAMLSQKLSNGDFEGFGIAILEANSLGIPAIGSSDSGIVDAISNKISGRLVEQNDIDNICNAVKEIMDDYNDYSMNAKKWSKQFEWEVVINKYLDLIEK